MVVNTSSDAIDNPKLGTLVRTQSGVGFPHAHQGKQDGTFPFYKVGSLAKVGCDGTIHDDRHTVEPDVAEKLGAKIIPAGSTLLAKIGAALLLGRFVPTSKDCCIDNNMLALIPGTRIHARYLTYACSLIDVATLERSGPVPTLDVEGLRQVRIPLPDLETQRAIADYLDRETAEIDAMSADLDEMEALLTERRSTSISQHLQSGSWPVAPIATMAEVTLGKMVQPKQKDPTDTEAPYLRAAHVPAPGTLNLDVAPKSMWFTPGELDHLTLRTGDVVIVEGGAGYGRAALVSTDLDGWGFQNSIIRVRAHGETAIGKFITYALLHAQSKGAIELLVSTATLPHFTAEKVERFRLPFPPIDEQRRIANEIDRETAEIDSMLADITELRDLLAERRAAIIAAAVTGQIDIPIHEKATHA